MNRLVPSFPLGQEALRASFLTSLVGSGSLPSLVGSGSFPAGSLNPLGATGLIRLLSAVLGGPNGSGTGNDGYETDYPVAGKVREKLHIDGSRWEERCPRGHLSGVLTSSVISVLGPYSWPPDLAGKSRTLKTMKKHAFYALFWQVFSAPPSPRAAFRQKCEKGVSKKGSII